MRRAIAALCCIGLVAGSAGAANAPDPLVKRHLEAKGTPYTVDDDNDFEVTVNLGDGRTQKVFILSNVNAIGGLRVRELWSAGYQSPDKRTIPVGIANRLLEHANEAILGAWVKQSQGVATFVIKLPANASADDLDSAIDATAATADKLELEFTGDTDAF